jgi:predicted nucleic acid-binding protein
VIVLDASAAIELLVRGSRATEVREQLGAAEWRVMAPHLLQTEVLQVLRRRVRAGLTPLSTAEEARVSLASMRIRYCDHRSLADRVWELRDNLSAYDASYIALAERLDCGLLTADVRLANAPGHTARVTVLGGE